MATIGRIDIAMGVDTVKFSNDLNTAQAKLSGFTAKIESNVAGARGPLESLSGSVGALRTGLAALGIAAGVGMGLKAIIGVAIDTEKTMAGLAKATGLGGEELAGLKGELQDLSLTLKGVPLEDLYAIAIAGGKLGIASGDLGKYTEGIAKLSATMEDIPAEQIADQVGKINSVFKLGISDAEGIGSAIAKVADSGVSASKDILEVTQRLSGTAAAAKITAAETVALAGTLLDTGTQSELAATTLQRLLMSLNDVEGQAGYAKSLGISAEEFAGKVRASPVSALREWLVALKGMDAQAQQSAIKGMGIDAIKAAGEIMKMAQQTDSLAKYIEIANREFATHDYLNTAYGIGAATTKSSLEQAGNAFKILADDIGSSVMPAVRGVVDVFMFAYPAIRSAVGGIINVVQVGFGLLSLSANLLFEGIGLGVSGMVKAFGSLGGLLPNVLKSISDPIDAFTEELHAKTTAQHEALKKLAGDTVIGRNNPFGPAAGPAGAPAGGDDAAAAKAAKHADAAAKAGAVASALADDVAKLNTKLEEQVATFGMSSSAAEIYKLKMAGASAEDIKKAEGLSRQLEALEANKKAMEEQAREEKKVADEIASIGVKLNEQVATFGKSGAQLDVYRLKQLGATDAVIAHAQALADQRDQMEKSKKAQDDLVSHAKDVTESTRTPMEKAVEEGRKLKEMLGKGLIDQDTFNRAGSKLAEDAFKTQGGGKEYHENAALELGSAEARSSILKFRGMGGDGDGIKDVVRVNREQLAESTQQSGLFRRLLALAEKPAEGLNF